MKRLLLVALLLLMALPVAAQEDAPADDPVEPLPDGPITGIVATDGLFVYTGPDYAYRFIGQLPVNASVIITGRRTGGYYSERWLQIDYSGQEAWIFARYVRTSIPYEDIPETGRPLPRNRNGRVPEEFDLSQNICNFWPNEGFGVVGDYFSGAESITLVAPAMPGANAYSVYVTSPMGFTERFSNTEPSFEIPLHRIATDPGTFTWEVVPFWTYSESRYRWQRLCARRYGGTFERPPLPEGE